MSPRDPHDLERFVIAQNSGRTYESALRELFQARKTSHWMWFIFPQIAGLGHSGMSRKFAIASLDEARAYLDHPVLGARLLECAHATLAATTASAEAIFGSIDAQKLFSSMTLFALAAPHENVFTQVLEKFFEGRRDAATEQRLRIAGD